MADDVEIAFDGLGIARGRIAEEARRRTGILDLCNLGLSELPADLFKLRRLRALFLGDGVRRGDGEWVASATNGAPNRVDTVLHQLSALPELRELSLAGADLESLEGIARLKQLRNLDCARTQVTDLAPLMENGFLQKLDLSGTQVSDLTPLAEVTALQVLNCSYAPVTNLTPLAKLSVLQQLDCSSTEVRDLTPLAALRNLQRLDCSYAAVTDLSPLAGLQRLQRLIFASTQVEDLSPLAGLANLQRVDCSFTPVSDLAPMSGLAALQWVHCSGSQVVELTPLAGLKALQVLFCSDTQVSDLSPLAGLTALRAVECSHTLISDLSPLAGIPNLQVLHCSGTQVLDLAPLQKLTALQVLYCSSTPVASLAPLEKLTSLQVLSCANTGIARLDPLARMTGLRELSCADTKVADLRPISALGALQWFSCSDSKVDDLAPLAGKTNLQWLSCAACNVRDLAPVASMTALQRFDGSDCRIGALPPDVTQLSALQELYLYRATVENVPAEVLSQSRRDNCLPSLRAHFEDLAEGAEAVPDVKLVILGNGRVGKTQLSRKLRHEDFQAHWDSTHGVAVRAGELAQADGAAAARLQIWDFGGQDIYHGTHTLFLRTRAVFIIAWSQDVETTPEYEHQGIRFRNHPLAYWVEYVRQFGDKDSPVLIVQTKADTPDDDVAELAVAPEELARFGYLRPLNYSAANDRGRDQLNASLCEAIDWLRHPDRQGSVVTGAGRARVRRQLEALRDSEVAVPVEQRQYRTLERSTFLRICEAAGGVGSVEHLLSYLNNAGAVFYRKGLFHDRIVLDQAWALDAIYAVFQRDKCYRQLQDMRGRFTRPILANLVWQDYSAAEQRLFLSMMISCGICFPHRPGTGLDDDTAEYIAPDLLCEQDVVQDELEGSWNIKQAGEQETFTYTLLPPSLLRSLIARVGRAAGANAIYWRNGVCVYETSMRTLAVITQEQIGDWGGAIRVHTQGTGATNLLNRLTEWIEEEHANAGLDPNDVARASPKAINRDDDPIAAMLAQALTKQPPLVFGQLPVLLRR